MPLSKGNTEMANYDRIISVDSLLREIINNGPTKR